MSNIQRLVVNRVVFNRVMGECESRTTFRVLFEIRTPDGNSRFARDAQELVAFIRGFCADGERINLEFNDLDPREFLPTITGASLNQEKAFNDGVKEKKRAILILT